jgi:RNA polymerase sigma-70 factor, ECF subfamily
VIRYDRGVEEEAVIRAAHAAGNLDEAVTLGFARYQVEVYSFLCARLRSEADAHEVFAQVGEDVWRGIAGFHWRCSFRTWLYTLARNAALRFERTPANQARRRARVSELDEPAAADRSRTRPYLRTDVKDRFAALRATLDPEDQTLLILRIDRDLGWDDIARIVHDGDADDATVRRWAANLRQRFRQLKARIQERAKAEGLLDDDPA